MRRKIESFRDLEIWQRSIRLVKKIYTATKGFPRDELYGLISQMRRSAVSIPSNMAEGFARRRGREYRQFLYVALGSFAELSTQVTISRMLDYLNEIATNEIQDEIEQLSKMTHSLISKLEVGKK